MRSIVSWIAAAALSWAGISAAAETTDQALRERAIAVLRAGLQSSEFWPSMHAAEALTLAGLGAEVVTAITPRVPTETDDQHRCGLARELIRAGVEEPLAVLTTILNDKQSKGRVHACESLFKVNRLGDRDALVRALDEGNVDLESMAAAALARQGDSTGLARLRARLADANPDNRNGAAWVLGQVGGPQDCAPILALVEKETDAPRCAFYWNALARLGAPGARSVVFLNLYSSDDGIRTYAADALVACGTRAELTRLDALLKDTVLDVRIRAAEAIVGILKSAAPAPAPAP
jgi:sialidase-1